MTKHTLTWSPDPQLGRSKFYLSGPINEQASLENLREMIEGKTVFDLAEITQVNSIGVSEWVAFMESIASHGPHVYERCSPPFVRQLSMIRNFGAGATVASVLVPYFCYECEAEDKVEVRLESGEAIEIPEKECAECQAEMEAEESEEEYFYFLSFAHE